MKLKWFLASRGASRCPGRTDGQRPGVPLCPSAGEVLGGEWAKGRASHSLRHRHRTSLCQKHTHDHPHPYLLRKPGLGTGSTAQPGRYRNLIPSPLGPPGAGVPWTESLRQMWKTGVSNPELLLSCLGFSAVTAAPRGGLGQAGVQMHAPPLTHSHSEPLFPLRLSGDSGATSLPGKFPLSLCGAAPAPPRGASPLHKLSYNTLPSGGPWVAAGLGPISGPPACMPSESLV